jgi:hypothetical protein
MRLAATLLVVAAVLTGAASASATLATFKTPSGNIGCLYDSSPAYLRCDIGSGLRPLPPRPKGCQLDWGFSLNMGRTSKARVTCAGDTALDPRARVLRYGSTWRRGPFSCRSRTTGLTCENAAGHGWFMSRQSWRRF